MLGKARNAAWVAIAVFIFLMWPGVSEVLKYHSGLLGLYVIVGSFSFSALVFLVMTLGVRWELKQ